MTRLVTLLVCLSACAGTETGNPSIRGKLSYNAYSSTPAVVALSAALEQTPEPKALLTVDHAWLVLGDVELRSGADCATGPRVHGLGAGDHATGKHSETELEIAAGSYCGLRFPFEYAKDLPQGAPESLTKESVLMRGTLPDGRAFELHSQLQDSLDLRATAGEFVLDSEHADVVIGFDLARWLGELRWEDATETTDGSVLVSADSNRALLEQFEAALPSGIALFRDHDGDGKLDADMKLAVTEP
jgi:hypothetical protein